MGTQRTPIQKTYEINVRQDSLDIDLLGANRQFDWTELSLVYDKVTNMQQYSTVTTLKWILK